MQNITILLSHPTGNSFVKGVLSGLHANGMLESFHTGIACFSDDWLDKLAQFPLFKDCKRRHFDSSIRAQTHTYPFRELGRLLSQRLKFNILFKHETGMFSVDKCYQFIDRMMAEYIAKHKDISGVYAYEDGAELQFEVARKLGIKCIYDLPIGYWRAQNCLLLEEIDKNPDWAMTLSCFDDSPEKLQRKDRELSLADSIFVASSFTKKTLENYPGKLAPITVVPYAFPQPNLERIFSCVHNRKMKILYVGGLTQRKGIAYLFEAIKGLEKYTELTVVGSGNIEICPALKRELAKCNYIRSISHQDVLQLMASHDLFIFPSLFEGFGLVITESMSQGTPVITTDRTCAPDIITHGYDSWIVEAGSAETIRRQVEEILSNPQKLKQVGQAALQTAKTRTWTQYGQETADIIKQLFYGTGHFSHISNK
jgi:glycosyltransferase involved in cell wall biosynthesis